MNHELDVLVNGRLTRVPRGASAAAAIAIATGSTLRRFRPATHMRPLFKM